ncbi:MAG: putative metal-dependent hydrolase [Gammaproteobacteria bacterium]|jgi:predicted metal-dependent hydrolase|nr:putative metal-dependent hydrolase [Gammaproteobacteria bacterium]
MILPDYNLRYSKKAKRLQLRISRQGLEVVVPIKKRILDDAILQFIQQNKAWITKHWTCWLKLKEQHHSESLVLPTIVPLPAINQTWEVSYLATNQSRITCIANLSHQIKLLGKIANHTGCVRALRQWLKKMAEQYLSQQLSEAAEETGLSFQKLTFRHTTSRWGSCSGRKHISLSCSLLFLPKHLVKHVLLHELCHTRHLNHGAAFWRLLERYDSNTVIHKTQLRKAGQQFVPAWATYQEREK